MAEALVSIALQKIADAHNSIALQKTGNAVRQQLDTFAGVARELERLMDGFRSIEALLSDAESRQVKEESVRVWLSLLKHVCYDVDDVLDEWEISGALGKEEEEEGDDDAGDGSNKICACLFSCYNSFDHVVSRYNVARRIKEIRERLDQIADEKNEYNFISRSVGGDHSMLVRSQHPTTSLMDESEVIIGRENDKETVISMLFSGSSSNEDRGQVQVVAIVGIGGLGKTTLARLIYHDRRLWGHLNPALYWVRVSEPFDVIRLTKEIIEEVKGEPPTLSELNELQDELLQSLRGKRYLLVLDDVWNDDAEKWEMLRLSLISGAHGSRILVTTRSRKVAVTMNATYIHELPGLSDDDSWVIFRCRAFAGRTSEEYSELENVGRQIACKCRGVPLAITLMGSVMNSKRAMADWQNILDSTTWSLREAENEILPELWMSYYNLPRQLKQCFAYCSVFPKDWVLEKDMLVGLWVAQGFIQSEENWEKDDIGDAYFHELVARGIFQVIKKYYEGKITYKMHDLVHDLAESIAGDEIYCSEGGKSEECPTASSSDVRHAFLSFANSDDKPSDIPIAARRAKKLRTLCLLGIDRSDRGIDRVIVDILRKAKFLRAVSFLGSKSSEKTEKLPWILRHLRCLDFSGSDKMEWPNVIVKMRHLRYLDFSGSDLVALPNFVVKMKYLKYLNLSSLNIVELPESVSHLHNLDTLDLTGCVKLKRLPRAMGKMVSLRHLEIERTDSLEYLPRGLGRISGLRSLCKFIVGGGEGVGCQIDELESLNSLQGILRIQHLEGVSSPEEAEKAELWKKQYLSRLVLSRSGESVVEGLRPHENLEELKLFWYTGSHLPSWMQVMQRLRKLELCGCPKLEGLLHHVAGESLIRKLMIRDCPRIKGIAVSSSFVFLKKISVIDSSEFFSSGLPYLPSLKTFEIRGFINETLPYGGWEQLLALQTLEIQNCSELKSLPDGLVDLQSLENLIIYGCDKLEWLPVGLGRLEKLKSLTMGVLKALRCLPDSIGQLESLKRLCISNLKRLESVPDSLGQLKNLTRLDVGGSEVLRCLPDSIGQLKSLERLYISNLKRLESLPHGLRSLSLLQEVTISACPRLTERCKRGGVDWPKISHIPCIIIDG